MNKTAQYSQQNIGLENSETNPQKIMKPKHEEKKKTQLSIRDKWNPVKGSYINTGFPEGEERLEQKQYADMKQNVYSAVVRQNALYMLIRSN